MYNTDRKYSIRNTSIGRLNAKLTGEVYPGEPVLDTEVSIEGGCLCVISMQDADKFLSELEDVILKYSI